MGMKNLIVLPIMIFCLSTLVYAQETNDSVQNDSPLETVEPVASQASEPPLKVNNSLQVDFGFALPYRDDFGDSGLAYVPSLTWQYHIKEDYLLGIVLARFQHHPAREANLYFFNYGFTFTHYIPKEWIDMGPFKFFARYGILLSQVWEEGKSGRDIAHHTLIGLGGEFTLAAAHRLGLQAVWTLSEYPTLGIAEGVTMATIGASVYYRLVFE